MSDLIDRDKVIEAIDDISVEVDEGYGFQYEKWRKYFCELPGVQESNLINVYGLEEEIRCAMCENPMCTDRGCDGGCEYDERLYDTIIKVLNSRIKKLPSVPRKGKWIFVHPLQMDGPVGYMCSNCKTGNFDVNPETWKTCPWCMADMRGNSDDN